MELPIIFFLIAMIYSSVGFGGGSSYLAILALFSLEFSSIRAMALICNLIVVSGNIVVFRKSKQIKWKKIIPLVLLSVPFAFIGGYFPIKERYFFIVLAITLMFAGVMMIVQYFQKQLEIMQPNKFSPLGHGILGSSIGFLSGLVGIGGGIFLAPILHLMKWDRAQVIAATSSVFIFANSLAGLSGQVSNHVIDIDWSLLLSLVLAVLIGGQIGSRYSNHKLNPRIVKLLTAILIIMVAIRILYKYN